MKKDNPSEEKDNSSDRNITLAVIRARAAKPVLFFLVLILAICALAFLRTAKEDFDKRENAPFLVVANLPSSEDTLTSEVKKQFNYVRVANHNELSNKILGVKSEDNSARAENVVEESLKEVQSSGFKNSNDLITAITELIAGKKEYAFKNDEKQIDKLDEEESRISLRRSLCDYGFGENKN